MPGMVTVTGTVMAMTMAGTLHGAFDAATPFPKAANAGHTHSSISPFQEDSNMLALNAHGPEGRPTPGPTAESLSTHMLLRAGRRLAPPPMLACEAGRRLAPEPGQRLAHSSSKVVLRLLPEDRLQEVGVHLFRDHCSDLFLQCGLDFVLWQPREDLRELCLRLMCGDSSKAFSARVIAVVSTSPAASATACSYFFARAAA